MITQEIIFEDDYMLVLNKPAGLLTIRNGYDGTLPNVADILRNDLGKIWIVHRLDKDTSGVLVFAKNEDAHRYMNQQFSKRLVKKIYHGIIIGNPGWNRLTITLPLLVNGDRKHRTVISEEKGKPAKTLVHVIERYGNACLVHVEILTGYTHQIRAHLSSVGFPILSDKLYFREKEFSFANLLNSPISRLALHSKTIIMKHPFTKEKIQFIASYPGDFTQAIEALRNG